MAITKEVKLRHKFLRILRVNFWGYFFIAPFLVVFSVFFLFPMINSIYLGFFNYGFGRKIWVGFDNYIGLFKDATFLKSLLNTFIVVIGVVPMTLIFALFVSSAVFKLNAKLASFFRAAYYLPIVTSNVVMAMTWSYIYSPVDGIANQILKLLHLKPIMWLANPKTALPSLIVIVITWIVGQPIILFLAALGNIPETYYEAATIDGASRTKMYWRITLPLLKPTTLYVIVTSTIGAFQTFAVVQLMTGGGPYYATSTIMFLLYDTAFSYGNLGLASAMGVILAVFISILAFIQFKFISTDVEY